MESSRNERRHEAALLHGAISSLMRSAGVGKGPWYGSRAPEAVIAAAHATEAALKLELTSLDQLDAIRWAACAMALSQEFQDDARSEGSPSRERALGMTFHSENAMAARAVLEVAVRCNTGGSAPVNELTAINLAKLGHQVWRWHLLADRLRARLCTVEAVVLNRDGTFDVRAEDLPPFSLRCFENSYLSLMERGSGPEVEADARLTQRLMDATTEGDPLPDELQAIDDAMRISRGYGLQACLAALSFLARWAGGPKDNMAGRCSTTTSLRDHALRNVADWYPHVDLDELAASLPWLTWSQELIQESPLALHKYRDVPARLYSRPVLELPDHSLFVPSGAPNVAMDVLVLRLLEGTWTEQLLPSESVLAKALERRRSLVRPVHSFELEVAANLERLGLPHATSIAASPTRPSSILGVPVRREIDAVVADARAGVLWVLEAKDLAYPFEAKRIRSELDKYFVPGGHVDKLDEKCADLRLDPITTARLLGVSDSVDWMVLGLFVTREPSPAACDSRCRHSFVTLQDLSSTIRLARRGSGPTA